MIVRELYWKELIMVCIWFKWDKSVVLWQGLASLIIVTQHKGYLLFDS